MTRIYFVICLLFLTVFSSCTTETEPESPKNIILFIGDGMGVSQVTAGHTASRQNLTMAQAPFVGLATTHMHPDQPGNDVTDSASSATALSAGVSTINGFIGVDVDTNAVRTILEIAHDNNMATGLISTSTITHATPASFIAHQPSRNMHEAIAADFLNTDIDLFIGGGLQYFTEREDGRNLVSELTNKGYGIFYDADEMQTITNEKFAGLFADGDMPRYSEGRGDYLPQATARAIQHLSQNENGYFLMVEGSQIDWGGHDNNMEYIIEELLDFDRAIGTALDLTSEANNTLIIITADHETGGTALNQVNLATGEVGGGFTTGGHTGAMVPVFAFGPGSEQFAGVYHNVEIFNKMMDAFGFDME